MKLGAKLLLVGTLSLAILTGCESEEKILIDEIKYDLSIEYDVPISKVKVKTIEYGITKFSTNQFEIHIEEENVALYLVAKSGTRDIFRRIPIKLKEGEE